MKIQQTRLETPYAIAAGTNLKTALDRALRNQQVIVEEVKDACGMIATKTEELQQLHMYTRDAKMQVIDYSLDRILNHISRITETIIDTYEKLPVLLSSRQQQRLDDALLIQEMLFAAGLRAHPQLEALEQWEIVEDLRSSVLEDKRVLAAFENLSLLEEVKLLHSLHDLYGAKVGANPNPEGNEESYRLNEWYQAYMDLFILAAYHGRENPDLYTLVYGPYIEQVKKQCQARAVARVRAGLGKAQPNSKVSLGLETSREAPL